MEVIKREHPRIFIPIYRIVENQELKKGKEEREERERG